MSARLAPVSALWVISVEDVNAWYGKASAGDEIVYAHGSELPRIFGAVRVGQLAARGIVHPFYRRVDGDFDFVARVLRPAPRAAGDHWLDKDARTLIDYLRAEVRVGQSMPTGATIATDLGLRGESHANNVLHRLRRLGLLDWRLVDGRNHEPKRRVLERMAVAA